SCNILPPTRRFPQRNSSPLTAGSDSSRPSASPGLNDARSARRSCANWPSQPSWRCFVCRTSASLCSRLCPERSHRLMSQLQAIRSIPRMTLRDKFAVILLRHPLELLTHLEQTYGDVVHCKIGRESVFFLNHPDDIRELLVVQHENFRKGEGVMRLDRMLGRGLITNDGPSHKKQRRLVQPAFHRKRIAGYAASMVDAAQHQAQIWQDGASIDMAQEMLNVTLVVVGKTLFNTDVEKEADTFHQGLATSMEAFRKLAFSPWGPLIEQLPFPINARLRQARASLDKVVYRVIDEHRQAGKDQGDLLSMLLMARDEDGSTMDELQLRDEVMTLFLAGHETVAHALTWTWYLLAL